ncbi:apolipoprotein N-acyltransferase [Gordonia sp. PKS22-38]|uniref:Apolipoprotein N-acyltransferase n=1 Tax=Gordonia prachuapensis TaxID=3115651 RepID=A0ABU7N117_9ACTN|nr:apolipoprotein N-acyltransferase [Gordonia sp. PKS22-38]
MILALRTGVAALAGVAMWAAFPPRNLWFLAVVGLGLLAAALGAGRPRVRTGVWLGFVFGLAFFVPLLPWIGVYVGPLPWLALAVALALYTALFGLIAVITMRLPVPPVWFTLSWVLVEWLRSSFPFGGFPWGRAAFSQVDGPLLPLASVLGAPGLSAAVALLGASIAWLAQVAIRAVRDGDHHGRQTVRVAALAVVLALVGPVAAIALTPDTVDRNVAASSVRVAAIQGNVPRLGLDFNAQRRAVLDNHVRETKALAAAVRSGVAAQPDLVAWPENASDISPLANPDAAAEITEASVSVGAPILVGTLVMNPDGRPTNTVLVWDGQRGPVDRYDKQIIQPFGEYLPWRGFFRMFSSYADMAGNFRPGSGPSTVTVPGRSGTVEVGVSTCWEVAFDRSARKAVDDGAQILYIPTNNATFGRTEMTYQQLAMSQVRAVEHGRAAVVAATSGVSAIIDPDGMIIEQSGIFTPAVLTSRLPLHDERTWATRLGDWPLTTAIVIAAIGFLFALTRHTRFSLTRLGSRDPGPVTRSDSATQPDRATQPGRATQPDRAAQADRVTGSDKELGGIG